VSTSVDVDVYAHDRSASSTFNHVGNAATRNSGLVKHFGATLAGVFTGTALYNGARDLTRLLIGQTEAAAEDEQGQRQLALQLHNSAGANKAADAAAEDWITTIGKQLGITDDELRPALARMVAATHDVSDAQDDVSLAMDVAAGRHKSLQTVVEALSKAEQGNTSGLGRLGVATKDAAGHALTLDQITGNLAKTYKGQAAAAADTAAGKYKIVDTQFHELGETIGYWLLPKAADFGAWILDDGVPAAQELATWLGDELGPTVRDIGGWFSDNQDDIENFAKTVGTDVVGGLKTIVDIGGDVVGFLDGLPGPVRSLGIEAGIAALVLPRLAGGLTAVGSAAVSAKVGVSGFVTGLSDAERRSGLLSRSLVNVAGVGGMVALEEGTRRGNKQLELLGSGLTGAAAGATIGSAVFPGVGTAIGAAGGFAAGAAIDMYKLHKQTDSAADSAGDSKVNFDDLKASLNQVTGAATKATRAMVLQKLQEDGIATSAGQLGIAQSDLIKASLGNKNAIERVNDAWKRSGDLLEGLTNQKVSDWLFSIRTGMDRSRAAIKENNAALDGTDRSAKRANDALRTVGAVKPQTDKWSALLIGDLNQAVGRTHSNADDIRRTLATEPGKARPDLSAVRGTLASQLAAMNGVVYGDAQAVGHHIQSGVMSGLSGLGGAVFGAVQQAIANGLAAAHAAGGGGGGGGGGGSKGSGKGSGSGGTSQRTLGDIVGDRLRGSGGDTWTGLGANQLTNAGANLLASLVNGLEKGRKPLNKVLDAIHKDVERKLAARDQLQALHDQLAGGFSGFQASVFSVQGTDQGPVTLDQLLAKAASEKATAAQVDQDVQALLNAGVSQDLIQQLQSQGSSGIEALHALAGANADQIKQIVDDNAAAQASYAHAGQVTADKFTAAQIAAVNQQLAIAQGVEKTVKSIADLVDRLDKVEFILHGSDLVASLVKDKKNKGKQ